MQMNIGAHVGKSQLSLGSSDIGEGQGGTALTKCLLRQVSDRQPERIFVDFSRSYVFCTLYSLPYIISTRLWRSNSSPGTPSSKGETARTARISQEIGQKLPVSAPHQPIGSVARPTGPER